MADSSPGAPGIPLDALPDTELVAMAHNGCREAVTTLILRHRKRSERLVNRLARKWHLRREDTEDARQEAVGFWLPEAIHAYDVGRSQGPGRCAFASLLHSVLTRRFFNFVRAHQRYARHWANGFSLDDAIALGMLMTGPTDDPAMIVEADELGQLLQRAVAELPKPLRALLYWVASGYSLRHRARRTGRREMDVTHAWCALCDTLAKSLAPR